MNCSMVKKLYGKHTPFEMEQIIKHQPIRIANILIQLYQDKAEDMAREIIHDCLAREKLLTEIPNQRRRIEIRNFERGR